MSRFESLVKEVLTQSHVRFVNQIDLRKASRFSGICDRDYWAWKTKDFPNGTCQVALIGLLETPFLTKLTTAELKKIVSMVVEGTYSIQRSNGSFEEAYPLESSFAVTGLVVFCFSYLKHCYKEYLTEADLDKLETILANGLRYIRKTPESHGMISNHLATAYLAVWLETGDRDCLDCLFESMNSEGWFPEYGGADPGYQSLLLHYFSMAGEVRELPYEWVEKLKTAGSFCANFFLSDGEFSGEVGSRGTSILYPASFPFVPFTEQWVEKALSEMNLITPLSVDIGNFAPVYISWSFFAKRLRNFNILHSAGRFGNSLSVYFPDAGLYVYRSSTFELIASFKNGVIRAIEKPKSKSGLIDKSFYGFMSSRSVSRGKVEDLEVMESGFSYNLSWVNLNEKSPNLFTAILVRLAGLVFYWSPPMQRWLKKCLKRVVMDESPVSLDPIFVKFDKTNEEIEYSNTMNFEAIGPGFYQHMASANSFSRRFLNSVS